MVHSTDDRPGWRYHTRVQSFRFFTVILGWALLVGSFYQKPELLTGAQRLLQHFIEFDWGYYSITVGATH